MSEYPCQCGTPGCQKVLAVARGIPEGTITLGIREHGRTVAQTYITTGQATALRAALFAALEALEAQP